MSPEPPLRSDPDELPEPTGEPAAEEGLSFEDLLEIAKAAGYVPSADSPRASQPTLDEMLEQRRAEERAALHHSLAGMYPDALADESLLHKLCVGAMSTLGPLDALMAILSARLVDDAADPARLLLRLEGLRKMSMVTRTLQQRVQSSLETAQLLRLRRRFDPTKVP